MSFSFDMFGDYTHPVIDYLEKSATYGKATDGLGPSNRQCTLTQQRHERCVVRQNADLAVKSRRDYRVRFTVEHRCLRGDHRDLHHPLASCLARAMTSSIPPCI